MSEVARCTRCNAQVPERSSAIVLSCPHVTCPVPGVKLNLADALMRLIVNGWEVRLRRISDRSSAGGGPVDPNYPLVVVVYMRQFDASGTRSVFGVGRRGEVDDAVRVAVRSAAGDARQQGLLEMAAELEET